MENPSLCCGLRAGPTSSRPRPTQRARVLGAQLISRPDALWGGTWSCDTPPCSPKSHSHLGKGDWETVPLGPASIPSSQGQQHGAGMLLPTLPMEKEGNSPKESTDVHWHTPRGLPAGLGHCRGATPPTGDNPPTRAGVPGTGTRWVWRGSSPRPGASFGQVSGDSHPAPWKWVRKGVNC